MIFVKNKVEEDLKKIRQANLPEKHLEEESQKKKSYDFDLEKNDLLAMILAVLSLVFPYLIAFVGIMAGVVFLLGYLY